MGGDSIRNIKVNQFGDKKTGGGDFMNAYFSFLFLVDIVSAVAIVLLAAGSSDSVQAKPEPKEEGIQLKEAA